MVTFVPKLTDMQKSVGRTCEFNGQQLHLEVKKPDDLACGAISILA